LILNPISDTSGKECDLARSNGRARRVTPHGAIASYGEVLIMSHHHRPPPLHSHSSNGSNLVPVFFEYVNPAASSVSIAGTFNHWRPEAKTMHPAGGGRWMKETALAPGVYEYCLVVDGHWMPDPEAVESVPNPYGGRNSVLRVVDPIEFQQAETE
jgi:1,4-alpha-glucan branching enzyme